MSWWKFLRPSGAQRFDVANTHIVELTKRRPEISLTKQGAAVGNMRVNLSWQMRTSDTGGWTAERGGFFSRQLDVFKPRVVQAAGPAMVNVDLDLACMYELADGSKGVVQPLGKLHGDLDSPPYVQMSGDDRFGGTSGETLYINFDKRDEFKRLLVFVYIYDGTPAVRPHAREGGDLPRLGPADRDPAHRAGAAGEVVRGGADREPQGRADRAARGQIRLRLPGRTGPPLRLGPPMGPRLQIQGLTSRRPAPRSAAHREVRRAAPPGDSLRPVRRFRRHVGGPDYPPQAWLRRSPRFTGWQPPRAAQPRRRIPPGPGPPPPRWRGPGVPAGRCPAAAGGPAVRSATARR